MRSLEGAGTKVCTNAEALGHVLGAHFNNLSYDLLGSEGVRFAKQVHYLADALVCAKHG
jgi:hypothetical protein